MLSKAHLVVLCIEKCLVFGSNGKVPESEEQPPVYLIYQPFLLKQLHELLQCSLVVAKNFPNIKAVAKALVNLKLLIT